MKLIPFIISGILLFSIPAFADTLQQSGIGNIATQNSNNTSINSGNTTNTVNSNNPRITANGGRARSTATQSQSADNSGNAQTVNYAAQKRNPVSTSWAAPLTATDDTCMGSTSAGGQGVGFGLSFGHTWRDEDCVRRKDARELYNMGHRKAALALLCQSEQVEKAMRAAGTPCVREELSPSAGRDYQNGDDEEASAKYDYPTGNRFGRE